jgi:hypothetical protein
VFFRQRRWWCALQAYIGNYTSHTKIDRLLFIAEHNPGKPLELEALKLAADEVKQVRGVLQLQPAAVLVAYVITPYKRRCGFASSAAAASQG